MLPADPGEAEDGGRAEQRWKAASLGPQQRGPISYFITLYFTPVALGPPPAGQGAGKCPVLWKDVESLDIASVLCVRACLCVCMCVWVCACVYLSNTIVCVCVCVHALGLCMYVCV